MILARLVTLLLAAVVLQISIFDDLRVGGVAPELLALVAVLAGVSAGPERGSLIGFAAGLLWDIYLPTPLGIAALAFALVAYGAGSVESGLFHDSRVQVAGLALIGTAAALTLYALLGEVVGQRGLASGRLVPVVTIASLVNSALAPLVVSTVRWAVGPSARVGAPASR